jgi:predicted DNA-binding antitoxin AbrB/MazE fold protein
MSLYGKGRKGLLNAKTKLTMVMHMGIRVKARYESEVLKPLEKLDLKEGEDVAIVIARSLAKDFRGALKLENVELIEEIAESDELI